MNKAAVWILIIGVVVLGAAGGIWYLRNRTSVQIPFMSSSSSAKRQTYDPPSKFTGGGRPDYAATASSTINDIITSLPENLR